MEHPIMRLFAAVQAERGGDPATSATANLFAAGRVKMAKKVVEEAAEVSLAFVTEDRAEVVRETADLVYNLVVLLAEADVSPEAVWEEMERREAMLGLAAKLPKPPAS